MGENGMDTERENVAEIEINDAEKETFLKKLSA